MKGFVGVPREWPQMQVTCIFIRCYLFRTISNNLVRIVSNVGPEIIYRQSIAIICNDLSRSWGMRKKSDSTVGGVAQNSKNANRERGIKNIGQSSWANIIGLSFI